MTSEDEISIQGSPSVTRRRLGSFNGQSGAAANSASGKDEKSPGWCFFTAYKMYLNSLHKYLPHIH